MPGSTLIRVAVVVAVIGGGVAGYRWWNSTERHVQRLLEDVASALSHETAEPDLGALAAVAALQRHLAADVTVDAGPPPVLRGRQDALSMAARVRTATSMMRVRFFDADVTVTSASTADVQVTAEVTTRGGSGEDLAAAYTVSLSLVQAERRWVVARARIRSGEGPPQ